MRKRYTEEQIIGYLREADAGLPIKEKELCRKRHQSIESSARSALAHAASTTPGIPYAWMWAIWIALGAASVLLNLPIRDRSIERQLEPLAA